MGSGKSCRRSLCTWPHSWLLPYRASILHVMLYYKYVSQLTHCIQAGGWRLISLCAPNILVSLGELMAGRGVQANEIWGSTGVCIPGCPLEGCRESQDSQKEPRQPVATRQGQQRSSKDTEAESLSGEGWVTSRGDISSQGKGQWEAPLRQTQNAGAYILSLLICIFILFESHAERSSSCRYIPNYPKQPKPGT